MGNFLSGPLSVPVLASIPLLLLMQIFKLMPFGRIDDRSERRIRSVDEASSIRQELAHAREDNAKKTEKIRDLITRYRAESTLLKESLEHEKARATSLHQELSTARAAVSKLQDEVKQERELHRRAIAQLDQDLHTTESLRQTLSKELQVSQAYLNTSDRSSGADVSALITTLNSTILDKAAFVADSFVFVEKLRGWENDASVKDAYTRIVSVLGKYIADLLARHRYGTNPFMVQSCLQTIICVHARWIMLAWGYPQAEDNINTAYSQIRQSERQAVAAQWRVKTRQYAAAQLSEDFFRDNLLRDVAAVLITAGVDKKPHEVLAGVPVKFTDAIRTIVDQAARLNKVIGQDVTSCDLIPFFCIVGEQYDQQRMEREDVSAKPAGSEVVFCTTDLGLRQSVKRDEGGFNETTLIKARVILVSELRDILSNQ